MFLMDVCTKKLSKFHSKPPVYATFSFVAGENDFTFAEFQVGNLDKNRRSFWKLDACCEQAKKDKIYFLWFDHGCVDMTNDYQLSELFMSRYRWYSESRRCYVYLEDVDPKKEAEPEKQILESKWFRDQWTLVALIAPKDVLFFNKNFHYFGSKMRFSNRIPSVTGICRKVLEDPSFLSRVSIADRMRWVLRRKMLGEVAAVYLMSGIFPGVNMPYTRVRPVDAFRELQLQIMAQSRDLSIFAWVSTGLRTEQQCGVLAARPSWNHFPLDESVNFNVDEFRTKPPSVTDSGILLHLPIVERSETCLAVLNCRVGGKLVAIHVTPNKDWSLWTRTHPGEVAFIEDDAEVGKPEVVLLFVEEVITFRSSPRGTMAKVTMSSALGEPRDGYQVVEVYEIKLEDWSTKVITKSGDCATRRLDADSLFVYLFANGRQDHSIFLLGARCQDLFVAAFHFPPTGGSFADRVRYLFETNLGYGSKWVPAGDVIRHRPKNPVPWLIQLTVKKSKIQQDANVPAFDLRLEQRSLAAP